MLAAMSNLKQRLIVSSATVTVLVVAIALSNQAWFRPIFVLLTASVISLALWEYYKIASEKHYQPLVKIGIASTVAYVIAIYLRTQYPSALVLPQTVLGLTFVASFGYYFIKGVDPFINLALTLFGIFYLTIPLSFFIDINYFPEINDGRWALVYLLLVTKIADASAFFIGKQFGTHKLSPYISPKKTLEGALGGGAGSLVTSLLLYMIFRVFFPEMPFLLTLWQSIWLALLITVAGQFGDLAESLLKRDVGVKDSNQLPGLGGVLDIVDSLVFTAPIMYIFLKMQAP